MAAPPLPTTFFVLLAGFMHHHRAAIHQRTFWYLTAFYTHCAATSSAFLQRSWHTRLFTAAIFQSHSDPRIRTSYSISKPATAMLAFGLSQLLHIYHPRNLTLAFAQETFVEDSWDYARPWAESVLAFARRALAVSSNGTILTHYGVLISLASSRSAYNTGSTRWRNSRLNNGRWLGRRTSHGLTVLLSYKPNDISIH